MNSYHMSLADLTWKETLSDSPDLINDLEDCILSIASNTSIVLQFSRMRSCLGSCLLLRQLSYG